MRREVPVAIAAVGDAAAKDERRACGAGHESEAPTVHQAHCAG